jgi:hypothetical protein
MAGEYIRPVTKVLQNFLVAERFVPLLAAFAYAASSG